MDVRITAEGEAQLALRKKWWRRNRPQAPDLFDRELAEAIRQIGQAPESFPVFTIRSGHLVRRCLMPKTRCHIYLEIDAEAAETWVLAAGGATRRRPPTIKTL